MSKPTYDLTIQLSTGATFKRLDISKDIQLRPIKAWKTSTEEIIIVPHMVGEWHFRREAIVFMGIELTQEPTP